MYDQETDKTCQKAADRSERQTNTMGDSDGKHHPVSLCFGYGNQLYAWPLGQRSGQRRNLQDDFTRTMAN